MVVIHKLDKGLIKGFVDPGKYLGPKGVELLERSGHLLNIPLEEIKGMFFVRDFEGDAQRLERKAFLSRPKLSGLWVRMTFKDNEVLEGLVPNDLLNFDPLGFLITPPDLYSNNVKVFIPRSALARMEVLGVIADGAARRPAPRERESQRKGADASRQIGLFSLSGNHRVSEG